MAADGTEHRMLDLTDYEPRDRALALAAHGCPERYTAIAREHLSTPYLTQGWMLFGSFVSRVRGLHEGVIREIAANNPHAVLPLARAWVEVITIALYVLRKPDYVEVLLHGPGEGRPGRKSFEAMFHAVRDDASQLRLVSRDLSDYSHFGTSAVWNAHSIEDEDLGTVSWTDAPRWRDENHFKTACAQAHELAMAGQDALDRLGAMLVPPRDE